MPVASQGRRIITLRPQQPSGSGRSTGQFRTQPPLSLYVHIPWCVQKCPYCEVGSSRFEIIYYANAISRPLQEKMGPIDRSQFTEAETETGFKDQESDSSTPVVVVRLTAGTASKIHRLSEKNTVKDGKSVTTHPVSDNEFGRDISIEFDKSRKGGDMYEVLPGDRTPLDKKELRYLVHDIHSAILHEDYDDAVVEAQNLSEKRIDLEDEEGNSRAEKPSKAHKSKAKAGNEEDDGDGAGSDDPLNSDDNDAPAPKKAKKPALDEDDDDAPPPSKKKPVLDEDDDAPAPKKTKKPVLDEDDDDAPPPKKTKKPALDEDDDDDVPPPKKRAVVDDDDDDAPKKAKKPILDEDDDDTPTPPKKRAKPILDEDDDDAPAPKKTKKPALDEDDDDDTPPPPKKKKPILDDEDE